MTENRDRDDVVLDVEHVALAYGDRPVLEEVTFEVRRGEFTGLIGTNGSGKTTLFRIILGLTQADRGNVSVAEGALGARSVGYVPQRVNLDPGLPVRVRDLVALGVDGQRFGWPRRSRTRDALVEEMIDAVGLGDLADQRVGSLSGGEQQRVLIAHALASRPRLLLLDEPLANLDPGSAQGIVTLLADIVARQDVAVLLSAHEINQLLPVMDRIVYIANGRAVSGTTDEVIRPDVLTALYGYHVDVVRIHGRVLVVTGESDQHDRHVGEHAEVIVE
jgi:zinc/manganese transport system ATP-binding protein